MTRLYKAEISTRGKAHRLIKNSEVIKVGDWIVDEGTGMANVDATTEYIAGFAEDIVRPDGVSLQSPSTDTGSYGGTWASATKSYTAAGDNETVDGIKVHYTPVGEGDRVIATLDAAKGVTTGSDLEGYYLKILTSDSSKLDESTSTTTATATQFLITNPLTGGNTTEVVVRVVKRQGGLH